MVVSDHSTDAFATLGSTWANGDITMHLHIGPKAGAVPSGSTGYNQAFVDSMATWNTQLDLVNFVPIADSTRPNADGDLVNHVFFDDDYYGEQFGEFTLAITTRWTLNGTQRVEADVVLNNRFQWSSYRGAQRSVNGQPVFDISRIALHELGHVLGLDHPDAHGQTVTAIMNSIPGDIDTLQPDDVAGARSLYGIVTEPTQDERDDFSRRLIALFQDELRSTALELIAAKAATVRWLPEYERYRQGGCTHGDAVTRVFQQILGHGIQPLCR